MSDDGGGGSGGETAHNSNEVVLLIRFNGHLPCRHARNGLSFGFISRLVPEAARVLLKARCQNMEQNSTHRPNHQNRPPARSFPDSPLDLWWKGVFMTVSISDATDKLVLRLPFSDICYTLHRHAQIGQPKLLELLQIWLSEFKREPKQNNWSKLLRGRYPYCHSINQQCENTKRTSAKSFYVSVLTDNYQWAFKNNHSAVVITRAIDCHSSKGRGTAKCHTFFPGFFNHRLWYSLFSKRCLCDSVLKNNKAKQIYL